MPRRRENRDPAPSTGSRRPGRVAAVSRRAVVAGTAVALAGFSVGWPRAASTDVRIVIVDGWVLAADDLARGGDR
jgi:hypothetical protein